MLGWAVEKLGAGLSPLYRAAPAARYLESLLAHILKLQIEPATQVIPHCSGEDHATRWSDPLNPRCNVYTITKDVFAFCDHVAEIDPNAQFDLFLVGQIGVTTLHSPLDLYCTGDCIDHTGELDQNPIARCLEHPSLVLSDLGVNYVGSDRLECGEGTSLILAHEPAVAHHIGS
jgi:hypothetical protein